MEYNEKCPNCGRNTFEAKDNGKCIYCGYYLDDDEYDVLEGVF